MGILSSIRNARRMRILERSPIPDELWTWALDEHRILSGLNAEEASGLRELSTLFMAEKVFYPVRGLELSDDTILSIAVQACLPILKLGFDWYRGWSSVIVTPEEFSITRRDVDAAGVVHEYEDELGGQVLSLGPVVLSMRDVEDSGWGDGYNVVIHEMAHKLDELDGSLDGRPPLQPEMSGSAWRDAFREAYDDFVSIVDAPVKGGRRGSARDKAKIDEYAADSPEEFFAVVCEYFFEQPFVLKKAYPPVYAELAEFFLQDPGARLLA